MEFKYDRTIPSTHIRLLRPLQITDISLSFTLQTFPRAAAPSYTALSYTWGTSPPTSTITLNNRRFPVRTNLWSALRYISQSARHTPNGLLWVDAVCINQSDIGERNEQVRVMDEIYKGAGCVAVWLGLAPLPEGVTLPEWMKGEEVKTLTVEHGSLWSDYIQDLGNREYWSRYWVIQEFLLARHLEIHCSNTSMDWFDFQFLVETPSLYRFNNTPSSSPLAALPLVQGRHPDKHPEIYQPFHTLLTAHHRSRCTDPRDRIFALLGLIPEDDRAFLGRVLPDYGLDVEVVRVIALAHIMQYDSLHNREPRLERLTPASHPEVFLGLGVEDARQATRLVRVAKNLDYIGDCHAGVVIGLLEDDDLLMAAGSGGGPTSITPLLHGNTGERYFGDDPALADVYASMPVFRSGFGEPIPSGDSGGCRWLRWVVVLGIGISGWYWLLGSKRG